MRERLDEVRIPPCTLPHHAFGPDDIRWAKPSEKQSVWAWISWPHKPAERLAARAIGWNDRVVIVEWDDRTGTRNTVVWRNAVTLRTAGTDADPRAPRER
nr:hypothetical protein [Microbacterium thalassium]